MKAQYKKLHTLKSITGISIDKGKLFKVIQQMVRNSTDVVGSACIRNKKQKVFTEENEIEEV